MPDLDQSEAVVEGLEREKLAAAAGGQGRGAVGRGQGRRRTLFP